MPAPINQDKIQSHPFTRVLSIATKQNVVVGGATERIFENHGANYNATESVRSSWNVVEDLVNQRVLITHRETGKKTSVPMTNVAFIRYE